jgi:hypothetical protein
VRGIGADMVLFRFAGLRLPAQRLVSARVAAHVLTVLGLAPDPDWLAAPPEHVRAPWLAARGADLAWAGRYLAPWVKRRLTGRSSGDSVTAKRPTLEPITFD